MEQSNQNQAIDQVLVERGNRYGRFDGHATVTQQLKQAMMRHPHYDAMPYDVKEALEMIQHKIGRIINGDPYYQDSWTDIIGYARLCEKAIIEREEVNKKRLAMAQQAAMTNVGMGAAQMDCSPQGGALFGRNRCC